MRVAQRVLAVFAAFALVLGPAGLAQAVPTVDPVALPAGVSVTPYALCVYGGVEVTNDSGSSINVKVKLDGVDFPSSGWTTLAAHSPTHRFSGYAPPPLGVYTVYLQNGVNEDLVATIPFVKPAFCGQYTFTWVDHCTSVDVTMKNNSGIDVAVNFTKLSGATFPVLLSDIPLAAGEQKTINIPVTDVDPADPKNPKDPSPWGDLAPRVIPPNELIEIHVLKGTHGTDCAPIVDPTPTPTQAQTPTAGAAALPATGMKPPWQLLGLGLAFVLLGAVAILATRRMRART